jgi:hypothetical protein
MGRYTGIKRKIVAIGDSADGDASGVLVGNKYSGPELGEVLEMADPRGLASKIIALHPMKDLRGDRVTFMNALEKYAGASASGQAYVQARAPTYYEMRRKMMDPMDKHGMIERFLEMVALPEVAELVRYGDRKQRPPTSINRIHNTFKYSWVQQPAIQGCQQLSSADAIVVVFNDSPFCSHIFYDPNAGSTGVCQPTQSMWIGPSLNKQDLGGSFGIQKQENGYLQTAYVRYAPGYQPHGPILPSKTDADTKARWTWVDTPVSNAGQTAVQAQIGYGGLTYLTITFPAVTAGDLGAMGGQYVPGTNVGAQIYIRAWNKGEPTNITPFYVYTAANGSTAGGFATATTGLVPASGGVVASVAPTTSIAGPTPNGGVNLVPNVTQYVIGLPYGATDYMAIYMPGITRSMLGSPISNTGNPATYITVQMNDTCSHYCHVVQYQFIQNVTRFPAVRMTAATILWSDVASAFAAEGTLAIVALDTAIQWQDMAQSSAQAGAPWSAINNTPDAPMSKGTWAMIKGCYAFCCPLQTSDLEIKNVAETDYTTGNWYDIVYNPVRAESQVLVASMNTVAAGMGNAGGQGADSTVTVRHVMEGRTGDQYTETETVSPHTVKACEDAILDCRAIKQVAENDLHLTDIWNWTKNAAADSPWAELSYKGIQKLGPVAAGLASFIPGVGVAGALGGAALSQLPPWESRKLPLSSSNTNNKLLSLLYHN